MAPFHRRAVQECIGRVNRGLEDSDASFVFTSAGTSPNIPVRPGVPTERDHGPDEASDIGHDRAGRYGGA